MIAKITSGKSLFGTLVYNKIKVDQESGKVLFAHKVYDKSGQEMRY